MKNIFDDDKINKEEKKPYIKNNNTTAKNEQDLSKKGESIDIVNIKEKSSVIINGERQNKSKVIIEKKIIDDDIDDDFEDDIDESEGKFIKRKILGSGLSAYVLATLHEIKNFFKSNKTVMSTFYSVLLGLLCVSLSFIIIFSVSYNKSYKELSGYSDVLSEKENQLSSENMKYLKDIMQNPTLFTILDSERCLEKYFFDYSLIISYANNKKVYKDITEYGLTIAFSEGDVV
jgi:hypothetical protein